MEFASRLLQYRKQQGLSQEDLAGRLGVSRQAVSKWETGEALPDLQKSLLLSKALGVSIEQLCGKDTLSEPLAQTPVKKSGRQFPFLMLAAALICLLAGFLLGSYWFARSETASSPSVALPDTISVTGTKFLVSEGKLAYRFIPSVAGDGYAYQVTFTGINCEPQTFDTACIGGICTGTADIPEYDTFSVNLLISNETESRSVPIAQDLSYSSSGTASWTP